MAEEKKRIRRSSAEIKAAKKEQYLKQIEMHKAAIADLEQKIKDLDKPAEWTKADVIKALKSADFDVKAVVKAAGLKSENLQ